MTSPRTTADYIALEDKYGARNYHPLDIVIERGEGIWLHDVEGRKYLDFLSSYSAVNQGHCHPRLVKVMQEQCARLTLTSRAFRNNHLGLFYEKVCKLTGMEKVLPMNSGAEAVETAIKAARKWGYTRKGIPADKAEIIVCRDNFHGRTTTIISFSTEEAYREGFGPFTPGFRIIPYGSAEELEKAITPHTCAFLVEPIQGEAGIKVPPEGYLERVREICSAHGILFIADEIQTGLGRTGAWFACDHENVKPDMYVLGKALGGGFYPVSAIATSDEVMSVFRPGDHGSTFGGNPLAAAVAVEALSVLEEEELPRRAAEMGAYFMERLRGIEAPHIREIRGKGLLIGVELDRKARPYCEALKDRGLLCKETHENVIRFAPPLVIGRKDIDWAMESIREVLVRSL